MNGPPMEREPAETITGLMMKHFDALLRYVIVLVGNETDARDIMQETSMALVRKAADYDSNRPFVPWACRFAYLETLKFREKSGRHPILLEDDVLEVVAIDQAEALETAHPAREALDACLEKLPPEDRKLLLLRYRDEVPTDAIGPELGMSRRSVFRQLKKVRQNLQVCIRKETNYA